MPTTRGTAASILMLTGAALLLTGCGGAESRKASHIHRGQEYFAQGDYAKASIEFRNAMQIAPKDPQVRLLAGRTEEKLGHFRAAAGLYQAVVDSTPDNVEAPADLGRLFDLSGGGEQALKVIEPALKKHPDDPNLLAVRGAARVILKDVKGAREDAERAVQLAPNNEDAVALLAGIYRQAGEAARGADLLNATLQRLPKSTALREVLVRIYLAEDSVDKAAEQTQKLIELSPGEWHYRYQLALLYAREHRLDDAQHTLESAIKALPKSDEAKLALVDFITTQRTREQGEKTLRDFIAAAPKDYQLRLGLGTLLERAGAKPEALQVYNEIIKLDGTGPNAYVARDRIAKVYMAEGRMDEADKIAAEVLQKNPRDNDALLIRGDIALSHRDATTAITDYRAVLRDQPGVIGLHRALARAFLVNGQPALAEEQLRGAKDLAPNDPGVRAELAQLLLHSKRADQAVTLLEESVPKAPNDGQLRESLIQAYLAKNDLPAARTAAADLEALQPKSAVGPFYSGLVAQGQKRLDDAEGDFERALKIQPDAFEPLSALIRLQISRGENAKATDYLKRLQADNPKSALPAEMLGEVYVADKAYPAAIEAFTRAIALAPKWAYPYRNLAVAKIATKDEAGAVAAYKSGISAVPGDAQLVIELATYYERKKQVDDAIAVYEDLYKRDPHSAAAANNLALLLATYKTDKRDLDRARDLTAAFVSSNDGVLLDTNGWVHFKRGELKDALPMLQRAVERVPQSRVIRYHLAMAELQSGQRDQARANLETALAGTSVNFDGADEARSVLASLKSQSG